jgi:hypothetical protein
MRNEYLRELVNLVEQWGSQITKLEITCGVLELSIWSPDDPQRLWRDVENGNQDKCPE